MNRDQMIESLHGETWDAIVIGGGATGLGIAVDAQTRGYRTLLLEQGDFAHATSGRSTKLVHGGVRYLKQGHLSLVLEALRERGLLARNAPHLVHELAFVIPCYRWVDKPFYGIGLGLYDRLARRFRFSRSHVLGKQEVHERLPNVEKHHLVGGVLYHDGQFEDARLTVALAQTATEHGATIINHMYVRDVIKEVGTIQGVRALERESGDVHDLRAKVVVNATGVFADTICEMDDTEADPMITPSQGVHLVLPRSFLPSETAVMVPSTDDGRVFFIIPWLGRVLVGTTDTQVDEIALEPRPLDIEVDFLLRHAARYLERDPSESDILSVFAGLRPLVRPSRNHQSKSISREHSVLVSESGLVTILGGKWTTYRKMAQDTVDMALSVAGLPPRACVTEQLRLHGSEGDSLVSGTLDDPMALYGSDRTELESMIAQSPQLGECLHPRLPYLVGQVVWAARHEMARTVEDVLARRTRSLLLDARAAIEAAPKVAGILAEELERDAVWASEQTEAFAKLARGYLPCAVLDQSVAQGE